MNERLEREPAEHQEFFQSICQEFGSAKVINLMVACFGEELTGNTLDKLGVSSVMPGVQLVQIYARNHNFESKGELR